MADSQFLLKNETHQIIGSAMEVLNEIGHGFHEKIYENALVVSVHQHHLVFRGFNAWRFFFLRERVVCGRHDRGVRLCGRFGCARDER